MKARWRFNASDYDVKVVLRVEYRSTREKAEITALLLPTYVDLKNQAVFEGDLP